MARQKIKDIKKELNQEYDEIYGDTTMSGDNPDPDKVAEQTVEEHLENVVGKFSKEEKKKMSKKGFNIGEEINKDEEDLT